MLALGPLPYNLLQQLIAETSLLLIFFLSLLPLRPLLPVTSENGFVLCARCVGQKCEEGGRDGGGGPTPLLLPLPLLSPAPLCTLDEE
jgi:hypothetical protein